MSSFWSNEFWRIARMVLLCWLVGLVLGFPLWGVIIGLVVYLWILGKRYQRFAVWMRGSLTEPDDFDGIFDDLAFSMYRVHQRSTKRKNRLSDLLRRWQDTSSALPDAVVVLDKNGDIIRFNQAASTLLGLKASDQGQYIGNFMRNPRFIHYLLTGDYNEHLEIASPLDITKILNIRMTPYGQDQRLMLVGDVTHIQRLMTMRRDFIGNVSHELRTPLTVIMGYLETMKDTGVCDEATLKDYIDRIEAPAQRMKSLVEDLLLLSNLDTGAPAGLSGSLVINVAAMLKNIVTEAEQLSNGQHTISLDVDSDIRLKGIEKEIYSGFYNLVINAVRYTPEGGKIIIEWLPYGDSARFCVRDNGPGIAREHLPRLTERFYRVDVGRSRSSGGTGLGLAIVKQVLRRHDAELHIESEPGKGSEFCCFFPQARIDLHENSKQEKREVS
ncbi:MAG: phosphate regulon sensor histidine kinase PhoR [Gammaproteobacteria bacterium]|nr:phosphate regulon sensor histidine kinase PhoR [Gammaproteobacteria bacterium]